MVSVNVCLMPTCDRWHWKYNKNLKISYFACFQFRKYLRVIELYVPISSNTPYSFGLEFHPRHRIRVKWAWSTDLCLVVHLSIAKIPYCMDVCFVVYTSCRQTSPCTLRNSNIYALTINPNSTHLSFNYQFRTELFILWANPTVLHHAEGK